MSSVPDLPSAFTGRWLDGQSAAPHDVRFTLDGDLVVEQADGRIQRHALAGVRIAEPLSDAPRLFDLPDGSVLASEETAALAAALAAAGHRDSRVVGWQRAWPAAFAALVLLLGGAVWLYVEGLPRAADWAATHVSAGLEAHMGDQTLAALDHGMLLPSQLPPEERSAISRRILAFEAAAGIAPTRRIEFRTMSSGKGINAFSLPGDTIVLLDGVVGFAGKDDEMLMAVVAHEAGHEARHHMTRSLFRALGGAALAGMLWGDYSSVATNTVVLFGQLNYSRDDERQADDFAIAALHRGGISPAALSRFFFKLNEEPSTRDAVPEWASTHPDSGERATRALEAAAAYDEAASASAPLR